jgi:hypothetical protein
MLAYSQRGDQDTLSGLTEPVDGEAFYPWGLLASRKMF